jgi:FtsP/CotA-like multicopper oxidase with cupredoxin domain
MYHPHGLVTEAEQIDKGLYGVFIIDPQVPDGQPRFDAEYILMLNGWRTDIPDMAGHGIPGDYNAWSINGKLYPQTEPIRVQQGQRIRLRLLNLSNGQHPMHLHGHDLVLLAQDGEPLKTPQRMNTLNLAPGQTYDAYFVADNPGVWMFHCHELHHAESGMVTTVLYSGFEPGDVSPPNEHGGGHE